jgi:tRNA 2-thiouridine synthesizing protein A
MADKTLDTQGLNCPLPLLKVKKAIQEIPVGGTLEVLASDISAAEDFQAFCEQTTHQMLEKNEAAGIYRFLIRRAV